MVIDYIAIGRDILGNVINCKVIPGKLVAPQHQLFVMDLKISKKRRIKRIRAKRINWWKLKTEKGEELRQKLAEFMVREDEKEELIWDNTYAKRYWVKVGQRPTQRKNLFGGMKRYRKQWRRGLHLSNGTRTN